MSFHSLPVTRDNIGLAVFLRDFFYAVDAKALQTCFASAGWEIDAQTALRLEYEFNRFFVGPAAPLAPPYASVYLEREPRLMGKAAQEVRSLYKSLGLAVPEAGRPDDFTGYELEAWLILEDACARTGDRLLCNARDWLEQHMASWLPLFADRIYGHNLSRELLEVTRMLEYWLARLQNPAGDGCSCANRISGKEF